MAVVLELFALAAPLLNQLVVDDAIATHDTDLLSVLIVGFALLLVIQTAVGLARSWMVMVLPDRNLSWHPGYQPAMEQKWRATRGAFGRATPV